MNTHNPTDETSSKLLTTPIDYPHSFCEFERSGESVNILAVAAHLVNTVICSAREYIADDLAEVFFYKYPPNYKQSIAKEVVNPVESVKNLETSYFDIPDPKENKKEYYDFNDDLSYGGQSFFSEGNKEEARHPDDIEWSTIERFTLRDVASQIRDFIELWHLMPGSKCALVLKDDVSVLKNKGFRYYVDAMFSVPTAKCPNPLAVAKVSFFITKPQLMPSYYPIMVTYRFEGFRSIYYVLGHRQMRSLMFQRFFIDTILHMKLNFYAELFECRFPAVRRKDAFSSDIDECEESECDVEGNDGVESSDEVNLN